MPNKTLYVKDSDLPLWEKAQAELGESVSSLFADCLRQRLEEKAREKEQDTVLGRMEKIKLTFWNENDEPVIVKSFVGRWLVNDLEPEQDQSGVSWGANDRYSVAQTKQGKLVVYTCGDLAPTMEIYNSFEDMRGAKDGIYPRYPENLIAETAAALRRPYEIELDI